MKLMIWCVVTMLSGLVLGAPLDTRRVGGDGVPEVERLPGSDLSIREAVGRSDLVAVVKVTDLGFGGEASSGRVHYGGMKVSVVRILNGEAARSLSVTTSQRIYPKSIEEKAPKVGQEYLVFVERPAPEQLRVVKMLRPTKENIRVIKSVLEKKDM